jgi:hypothetical protein
MPDEKVKVSMHVLPASATLLGLCFVVLSSIKVLGVSDKTLIDELSGAATLFFLASSIFSYASMRTSKKAVLFERLADIIFIGGLFFLTLVSLVIVFGLVK